MIKKVFDDPIVQVGIDQSRRRLEKSRRLLGTTRSIIDASREAISASRALIRMLPERSIDAAEIAIAQNPLRAMDDQTIGDLIDDLTAAYAEARIQGDEVEVRLLRGALESIGRYLAEELGPKAAGIPLS